MRKRTKEEKAYRFRVFPGKGSKSDFAYISGLFRYEDRTGNLDMEDRSLDFPIGWRNFVLFGYNTALTATIFYSLGKGIESLFS